ncbi:MAG: hypothetical protein RI973_2308 [Bacteroidota bacterium]|jgi:hypothetical protein
MLRKLKLVNGYRLLLFLLLLAGGTAMAQPKDHEPYSRFGLGEPIDQSLSAFGFAGLSATYSDPLHVNIENPASLAGLTATTFEIGMYAKYSHLTDQSKQGNFWSGNLSHLVLAMPMHNRLNDLLQKRQRKFFWTMTFALLPSTQLSYDVYSEKDQPVLETAVSRFKGTGGTSNLLWGHGLRYKNLSVGLNLGYLFGQLENERIVSFPDLPVAYTDRFIDNFSIRAFQWNAGVQYRMDFDKAEKESENVYMGRSLVIGAYGNTATALSTRSVVYRLGEYTTSLGNILGTDTLFQDVNESGEGTLPAEYTLGLMYQKLGKFRLGAEYQFQGWSNYEIEAKPETLFDSRRVAVGVEYIPDISSYNNYLKRIRYRAGFYHRTDARFDDLVRYGLTLGAGLPLVLPRQQTSFINVAIELGQYNSETLIKENFIKFALGFTLNDNSWFFKRRYN